ncbi:MAG TPA: VWA domain-containing protein, partial [Actinoplanes sp.]|nr:VWA domain-containing protein [Actinoplanes sp.]
LLGDSARPQLSQAGLDPPLPGCATLERNACVPNTLNAMLEVYRQAKLPGRVLLAVDASGSMAARTGPGRATRFTVASDGVLEAVGHLGPRDEFGLWAFPNANGRRSPKLVKLAPGSLPHRNAVARALRGVRPAGATPLYATVLAGLHELAGGDDAERVQAMVVLTDGEDTSDRSLRQTAAQVRKLTRASGVRLYVIATGDARCDTAGGTDNGLRLLTDAARGECLTTSPGKADSTMAQLFATLWGGR